MLLSLLEQFLNLVIKIFFSARFFKGDQVPQFFEKTLLPFRVFVGGAIAIVHLLGRYGGGLGCLLGSCPDNLTILSKKAITFSG